MCCHPELVSGSHKEIPNRVRNDKKVKAGFTLAEVLITLGIIGVVAAMTIPTLISGYKKKEYSTKLKKFYSMMNQAIQMSTIESGPASAWSYPADGTDIDALKTFWSTYFEPYLKVSSASEERFTSTNTDGTVVTRDLYVINFQDGTSVGIRAAGAIDFQFDVNGSSGPNTFGKDQFDFIMNKTTGKFSAYTYMNSTDQDSEYLKDRDNALQACIDNGFYCSLLLFLDNWEFKDDYPFKL